VRDVDDIKVDLAEAGAEEGDDIEEMERMIGNRVSQAKQFVYQQHLELDNRDKRGMQGFSLGLGDDVDEDRGNNFDSSDIDYSRFLDHQAAREGKEPGGSSFGKQFEQFGKQDGAQAAAEAPPSGGFNFENDLQSNEISLQDMHKRLNLKNELLEDEEEPMLGGINSMAKAGPSGAKLQKFEEQQRIQASQQ
jgi:hypothetical protein